MIESAKGNSRQGSVLGLAILVAIAMPQLYWLMVGYAEVSSWEKALWAFVFGTVLISSYYFREYTFLFRSILWVFRRVHIPPGEWFAIVYGLLFFAIATYFLAIAS